MNKEKNCDIVGDLLPGYQENLLSDTSKNFVEQHLHSCPDCQHKLSMVRQSDFSETVDESQEFIDYLGKTRKYQRKLLSSNIIISFILGMALYYAIVPRTVFLLNDIVYNPRGQWNDALKMITAGCMTTTLYLIIYHLSARKHRDIDDNYSKHILLSSIILLLGCILTFALNIPYLLCFAVALVILYRIVLGVRK